jgi:hypothetical protein
MQALFGLFAGSAAAAPAATAGTLGSVIGYTAPATAATTTAATTAGGFSIAKLLAGGATVLSAVSSIAAGNAQADAYEQQASEARMQQPLSLVEGLQRRNDLKKATMAAVAEQDVAYAASGADLSFGTPTVARANAFHEGDYALNSNANTTGATIDQLGFREKSYLSMAARARTLGMFDGLVTAGLGFSRLGSIG